MLIPVKSLRESEALAVLDKCELRAVVGDAAEREDQGLRELSDPGLLHALRVLLSALVVEGLRQVPAVVVVHLLPGLGCPGLLQGLVAPNVQQDRAELNLDLANLLDSLRLAREV